MTLPIVISVLAWSPRNAKASSVLSVGKHEKTRADFSLDQKVLELELSLPSQVQPVCKRSQTFDIPVLI